MSDEEHAALLDAAGDDRLSDWLRDVATTAARLPPVNLIEVLLAEVIALRRILLNLHQHQPSVPAISKDDMAQLIAESDAQKLAQARARLASETEP